MTEQSGDRFAAGVDLFNAGRFFEAHEAWEQVWLRSTGNEKIGIQGLIQAAAAILHLERGNREGAYSLYEKACDKLVMLPQTYRELDIGELKGALKEFFDAASAAPRGSLPPRPKLRRINSTPD